MVIAHAVRDHGRHERFDCAQHGDGEGGTEQAMDEVRRESAESQSEADRLGIPPKRGADGFHGQL